MLVSLPFKLTPEEMEFQYDTFRKALTEWFPSRITQINKLYDYYEDRILIAPASGTAHYHNAFPGGYIDHVLRVVKFAELEYKTWQALGFVVDNFTVEELKFAAVHHDLGKLGLPYENGDVFLPNHSEWHIRERGEIYEINADLPFSLVQDTSLYLLQHFGIQCTHNEWYAIRVHDGVYDKANESYYINRSLGSKFRCNLPMVLHMADAKAARWEFERWANCSGKFKFSR